MISSMFVVDDAKCVWVFLRNPLCLSQLFLCMFMVNQGQICVCSHIRQFSLITVGPQKHTPGEI